MKDINSKIFHFSKAEMNQCIKNETGRSLRVLRSVSDEKLVSAQSKVSKVVNILLTSNPIS